MPGKTREMQIRDYTLPTEIEKGQTTLDVYWKPKSRKPGLSEIEVIEINDETEVIEINNEIEVTKEPMNSPNENPKPKCVMESPTKRPFSTSSKRHGNRNKKSLEYGVIVGKHKPNECGNLKAKKYNRRSLDGVYRRYDSKHNKLIHGMLTEWFTAHNRTDQQEKNGRVESTLHEVYHMHKKVIKEKVDLISLPETCCQWLQLYVDSYSCCTGNAINHIKSAFTAFFTFFMAKMFWTTEHVRKLKEKLHHLDMFAKTLVHQQKFVNLD